MATPQNDDVDGDNIVSNDDNASDTGLMTPVASRAIIQEFMGTSTTPEASASLLPTSPSAQNGIILREWTPTSNYPQMHHLPSMSSPMPPVAPAELIIQREESATSTATVDATATATATATRTSQTHQYPVATFVTNLVRSVSENVREEIRGYRAPCSVLDPYSSSGIILHAPATITTANGDNDDVNNNNVNINNDVVPISSPNANDSNHAPLVAELEDANQEWTMVNGELVRLDYPREEDRRENDYESPSMENSSSYQKNDRRNTKSSRIQRSVRKLKKLRKIFSGSNGAGSSQKRKGDRDNVSPAESTRREEEGSREQGRYQQENLSYGMGGSHASAEFNESGESGGFSVSEALNVQLHLDAVSDEDNESGDGGSLIEPPSSQQVSTLSHLTTSTATGSSINYEGENLMLVTSKFHSEEFSIRSGSIRSTSSPTNNASPKRGGNNQGQKKKSHRLPRWLRNTAGLRGPATDSSSSNRSMPSTATSGSASSLQKSNRPKHPPLPPRQYQEDLPSVSNSMQTGQSSHPGNESLLSSTEGKPPALPPLRETSREFSSTSFSRPPPSSLLAESPLHAAPLSTSSNGNLQGFPTDLSDQNALQMPPSIAAHASFVCHADSITSEAALLPQSEYYIEDRLDEYDKYDMKGMKNSMKFDKQIGPSIDTMLKRAGEIATSMREEDTALKLPPSPRKSVIKKGKSDGESVPLSMADPGDEIVHNDTMKLILVGDNAVDKSGLGRLLRNSTKKSAKKLKRITLAVDVQPWTPSNTDVRFTIWDVLSSKNEDSYLPNFGAHPGTQSLFFSDRSLYLLVYDLGASNPETLRQSKMPKDVDSDDEESDDEWDEHYNDFNREEANRKADRALEADIKERVLSWVDCIVRRGTHSAILPIALLPSNMSTEEEARRLHIMKTEILKHREKLPSNVVRPEFFWGLNTDVVCVSLHDNILGDLEKHILEIANASPHLRETVPPGTVEIMHLCRDLKSKKKMILVDHLVAKLPNRPQFSAEAVSRVLKFLATIGEVLYFGDSDFVLKDHVILCRKWLVGALSCILRNDLQREVSDARDFLRWQAFYSDEEFPESNVTQTFTGNNSSCPILSHQDTQILWQSTNFMMEAVDQVSQRSEDLSTMSTMFDFLQHLLEHTGVFLPLEIDRFSSTDKIYFVPSLLPQASSRDVWTYKCSKSWTVTLCHTWLFRDGAPAGLMEQVTVALLRDLYESCHASADTPTRHGDQSRPNHHFARSHTFPFAASGVTDFMESHDGEPIGQIKIRQINCWKNSLLIEIGRHFPHGNELRESQIEIFVALTDRASPHCVASDVMRSDMQRLVVSGIGEVGLHGQKLWKGGYNIVLDSIKTTVANHDKNVERQVVCPECLAHRPICNSNTWSWDSLLAASGHTVRCIMGHKVDRHMICGTAPVVNKVDDGGKMGNSDKKPIKDLLPSVVLVGLWDNETKTIQNVGSGFIANKKLGLVVTASHILFNMEKGSDFGTPHNGLRNFRVIIGTIPNAEENNTTAVFRYFADIVADDIHNMDACILKIKSRLVNDVQNHAMIREQPERFLDRNIQEETLSYLKTTSRYEIEQSVRIIGFNQGGEGRLESGKHVNRTSDFAPGSILKQFKIEEDDSTTSDDSSTSEEGFLNPREEIVIRCRTIDGHSGGPCVNNDGKVIGILSRSDPADSHRCYLVPSSEIKILITKAKDRLGMGY
eukprot:CAMPEP_0116085854 /NCGR_PEP_ID=MMETSP0327-20121206/4542_1 /TAXON_ID=44447 /ORGANISM="Pseudo-nitzschia delicatissima, Strain B596" /LENGTH=1697 /DNA_ID=CAMNT_0003576863 /DNA_START=38 /DNA_END=5131 /DNA_ORIENTATION=-